MTCAERRAPVPDSTSITEACISGLTFNAQICTHGTGMCSGGEFILTVKKLLFDAVLFSVALFV